MLQSLSLLSENCTPKAYVLAANKSHTGIPYVRLFRFQGNLSVTLLLKTSLLNICCLIIAPCGKKYQNPIHEIKSILAHSVPGPRKVEGAKEGQEH